MVVSVFTDDTISRFSHEISKWLTGQEESEEFQQFIRTLALPTSLQCQDWRSFDGERGNAICVVCTSVVNSFLEYRKKGTSEDDIATKAIEMCNLLTLQTDSVCKGVVSINLVSRPKFIALSCYKSSFIAIMYFWH